MKRFIFISFILFLFPFLSIFSCTSGIIAGRLTKDGRPLLFKHRDTGEMNNRIEYFNGAKFGFLALVDSPSEGGVAWTGSNEKGFCIINTASYNLKDDNISSDLMDKEGILMFKALGVCAALSDFENFLDTLSRPMGVEANFGVIDADGGAAYYEVNNNSWKKFDVNDPDVAPYGYYVVTNFSYSGREDQGMGYIRNESAKRILKDGIKRSKIDAQWIFDNISRSFYNSLLDIDLRKKDITVNGWFVDQDFIPRKSSAASVVFQGVLPGEDPGMTIMWSVLGYPPLGVAVPVFVKMGYQAPNYILKSCESDNAEFCDLALAVKDKVFSVKRGNGNKYFNFGLLYDKKGKGYSQQLSKGEDYIFKVFNDNMDIWRKNGVNIEILTPFYSDYYDKIKDVYLNL